MKKAYLFILRLCRLLKCFAYYYTTIQSIFNYHYRELMQMAFRIFLFDRFTLSAHVEDYKSRYKVHIDSQEYTKRCMLTIVYVAARYFVSDAPVLVHHPLPWNPSDTETDL